MVIKSPSAVYQPRDFKHLLGLPGFSDKLLENHFALYSGYVANTNKLLDAMGGLAADGKANTPEFAELRRRFGWEWNGMRLHELYFGAMNKGAAARDPGSPLGQKLAADFGSYEAWEREFKATGAMRGIGWAMLYYDALGERLLNAWINEHDVAHLAGCAPILILDVFEHAYMLDYGIKRADYIEAFFRALDWKVAAERFVAAQGRPKPSHQA